jgi:hypothetical protein
VATKVAAKKQSGKARAARFDARDETLWDAVKAECRKRFEAAVGRPWSESDEHFFRAVADPSWSRPPAPDRSDWDAVWDEENADRKRQAKRGRELVSKVLPAAQQLADLLDEAVKLANEAPNAGPVLTIVHSWAHAAKTLLPVLRSPVYQQRPPKVLDGWAALVHMLDHGGDILGIGRLATIEEIAAIGLLVGVRLNLTKTPKYAIGWSTALVIDQAKKHVFSAIKHGLARTREERAMWLTDRARREGSARPAKVRRQRKIPEV